MVYLWIRTRRMRHSTEGRRKEHISRRMTGRGGERENTETETGTSHSHSHSQRLQISIMDVRMRTCDFITHMKYISIASLCTDPRSVNSCATATLTLPLTLNAIVTRLLHVSCLMFHLSMFPVVADVSVSRFRLSVLLVFSSILLSNPSSSMTISLSQA